MKFKITILDMTSGTPQSEIIEQDCYPAFAQQYSMQSGGYGPMVKIELIMEASEYNTVDLTEQN